MMAEERERLGLPDGEAVDWEPRRHEAAVRYMRRPHFCRSSAFRDLRWRTNYGQAHNGIIVYVMRLYEHAAEHGVPLRLHVYDPSIRPHGMAAEWLRRGCSPVEESLGPWVHHRLVMMEHATLGLNLPDICWEVLRKFALIVASRSGFGTDPPIWVHTHPWVIDLGKYVSSDAELTPWQEFRQLERQWHREFRAGSGGG